ncbi:MAG TPA: putative metal-binding motif-containing protein [Polyangiaceae bacterium]|nr:putative metal-binding motif-containing protein [Polyangiaceae bacterium]
MILGGMIVGLKSAWVGIFVGGAMLAATACSVDEKEFSEPTAGSAGSTATGGDTNNAGTAGSSGSSSTAGGAGGADTEAPCEPGATESCYASADGVAYPGKPPAGQTTCRLGERKCEDDTTWGVCIGAVAPEAADTCEAGNDANCNGVPNEGCACADGDKRDCGSDVGNCKKGSQTCQGMVWGACTGEVVAAATDTCDADDDANCNGTVNDGCTCVNGTVKPCGTDTGPCEKGTVTCVNGVYPETCEGGIEPAAADTCEPGNDADCDGTANEGCTCTGTTQYDCGIDTGACSKGKQTCSGGTLGGCMGGVTPKTSDTCLAADDANDTNCNGIYRDGCTCVATDPANACGDSGCGTQTCNGATGKWNACVGDQKTLRCNPNAPDNKQICGANGAWVASACPTGSVCRNNGADCKLIDGQTCTASSDCAGGSCGSFYLDADKDGYRANGAVAKFCGSAKTGYVAVASSKGDDCDDANVDINPGATEICDGIDNDCDGKLDMADNAALKLSGNAKAFGTGVLPSITAAGSIYGIVYGAAKTYLTTLNQNNTIALAKTELAPTQLWHSAIAWNGSNFGIFYMDSSGEFYFRRATTAGAFTPASAVDLGHPGGSGTDANAFSMPNKSFYLMAWGGFHSGNWGYGYTVDTANAASAYLTEVSSGRHPSGAVSGTTLGVVYHEGDLTSAPSNPPQTVELSIRSGSNVETKHVQLRPTANGARKPVIAPRNGGGFAVMWSESLGISFQEFNTAGSSICGPTYIGFTDFEPDQMVQTKRGYLAVSGYNKVVKGQEVLNGCTYGQQFTDMGSGTATSEAHIAAGTNGFAVVWSDDQYDTTKNAYARTFGVNLCD